MKTKVLSLVMAFIIALGCAVFVSCKTSGAGGEASSDAPASSSSVPSSSSDNSSSEESSSKPKPVVTEPIIYQGMNGKAHITVDSVNSIFICTFDESNLIYDYGCEIVVHILTNDSSLYRMTTTALDGYSEIVDGANRCGVAFKIDRQWNFEEFPVEITVTFASYRFNFIYEG